ncbi:MAG: alpha/beta fold hydrolase [Gemmatimonas sp.]
MRPSRGPRRAATPAPTIICLHASGGSGGQWKTLASLMQHEFRVLTPDLYGHGAAPAWQGAPDEIAAADAERVACLADDAGGGVHLVGHSYGGAIALRVALLRPASVASVAVYEPVPMRILFDYNPRHRPAAEVAEVARDVRRALNGEDLEGAARRFVDYWSGAGHWAQMAPEHRVSAAGRMTVIDAHFGSLIRDAIALHDYANIRCPVRYLTGRRTRASARRMAELLKRALPHVGSITLDGMGHLGPVTHADGVAREIARFIRSETGAPIAHERKAA